MNGIEAELDREELIALVFDLRKVIVGLREENVALRKRVEELEGKKPTKRLDESYSLRAEERRQELKQQKASGKKRKQNSERRGRRKTQEKIDEADRAENVLPDGCDFDGCTFVRERPIWQPMVDGTDHFDCKSKLECSRSRSDQTRLACELRTVKR